MLRSARAKARAEKSPAVFKQGDIQDLRLGKRFDAVLALFNVAGYQKTDEEFHRMLETAYVHLRKRGILVFDFWYGPAVMAEKPVARLKEVVTDKVEVLRFAEPLLDHRSHRVAVHYRVLCLRGRRVLADVEENHEVRFFFRPEILEALREHGLKKLHLCEWMRLDVSPSRKTWNACVVVRKTAE